jgi:hypothetical protein
MFGEQDVECGGAEKVAGAAAFSRGKRGALGDQRFRIAHDCERRAELDFAGRELREKRTLILLTARRMASVNAAAIIEMERTRLSEGVLPRLIFDRLDRQTERPDQRDVLRFHVDRPVQGSCAAEAAGEAQRRLLSH